MLATLFPRTTTCRRALLVAAALALPLSAAHAAPILDANYSPASTTFVTAVTAPPSYGVEDAGQTFTVQNTGVLVELDLLLQQGVNFGAPTGNLVWDIRGQSGGAPGSVASVRASGLLSTADVTAIAPDQSWVAITGLSVPVTAGDALAIVLYNDGTNYFGWGSATPNPYPDGGAFDNQGSGWTPYSGFDQAFRTYVAVPEPGSLALLACGAALLIRRR